MNLGSPIYKAALNINRHYLHSELLQHNSFRCGFATLLARNVTKATVYLDSERLLASAKGFIVSQMTF